MYVSGAGKMGRKGMRRLDLWLPEDHPIWRFPAGQRTQKVRELIDLGLRLEKGFDGLREEIQAVKIELEALRQNSPSSAPAGHPTGVTSDVAKRFLAAFD